MKIDRIKRLLAFLKLDKFESPTPLPHEVCVDLQLEKETMMRIQDKDVVSIKFSLNQPKVVSIFTARESHHNGDFCDRFDEEIPVTDGFLDFAISVLRNRAYNKIAEDIRTEEQKRLDLRIRERLFELKLG